MLLATSVKNNKALHLISIPYRTFWYSLQQTTKRCLSSFNITKKEKKERWITIAQVYISAVGTHLEIVQTVTGTIYCMLLCFFAS